VDYIAYTPEFYDKDLHFGGRSQVKKLEITTKYRLF